MCGNNSPLDAAMLTLGLNFLSELLAAESNNADVLASATSAYQQGKITKTQYIAVINALDEQPARQSAWVQQPLKGHAFLNQYRR